MAQWRCVAFILLTTILSTGSPQAQTVDELGTAVASGDQQPAGPPPTPAHTGILATIKELGHDVTRLPSLENLMWAGIGGAAALSVHPLDDNVHEALINAPVAKHVFKPGAVLGQSYTLLPITAAIYVVGRSTDRPKVSHVGMDLFRSLALSEGMTQGLKYATRRERPDGSSATSFPSGHAADTFAVATALERHLGWRYSVPAYVFASYVAASRLPANRHWLSDVAFGGAVGIIAGRTVTTDERSKFPISIVPTAGGAAVVYRKRRDRASTPGRLAAE